jgi:rod shape-determining protein MreC
MAIYSAGRRRTIIILLLTSILLITLDLRGNAIFNAARSGFSYALRPFEIAGEVITTPVARVWSGITEVDDLKAEIERLQRLVDEQRNAQVAGINAMIENRDLRAQLNLKSLAAYDRVSGEIIGSSPSNFDQRVEIDRGSLNGIEVGMAVVNEAGLVGKITQVNPETSVVMLVTDPLYHVPVKVVGEVFAPPSTEPPVTAPSGLPVDDVTTTTSTTSTSTTSTTVPPDDTQPVDPSAPSSTTTSTTTTSSTSTTTTLPEPIEETRETGDLNGFGSEDLPRVRFIADSPQFGRPQVGDQVLTSGGSLSLAPPGIAVGTVANVIENPGTAGLELEVELNVDLGRLSFLSVILYQPPTPVR